MPRMARRTARRTTRRTVRRRGGMRRRRRRRRLVVAGGFVLLAAAGTAAAVKLTQQDSERIAEHTGTPAEDLTEEELVAAMEDLGIQSIELTDDDQAIIEDAG
jgi:hypothetical protein